MSIRTNKMLAARADHYGSTCKLWFPCTDTGNNITDIIAGVVIPDAGTAEHNEPHAISIITDANKTGTGISGIQIPRVGMAIAVFKTHAVPAVSTVLLGASVTNNGILLGTASNALLVNGNTEANAPVTAVIGSDYAAHAIAWDTTNAYCYFDAAATKEGIAVTLESSSAISAAVAAALPAAFTDMVSISAISPIDLFGVALFDFGSALPSDLLTGIQSMTANWFKGEKTLYKPWASL